MCNWMRWVFSSSFQIRKIRGSKSWIICPRPHRKGKRKDLNPGIGLKPKMFSCHPSCSLSETRSSSSAGPAQIRGLQKGEGQYDDWNRRNRPGVVAHLEDLQDDDSNRSQDLSVSPPGNYTKATKQYILLSSSLTLPTIHIFKNLRGRNNPQILQYL